MVESNVMLGAHSTEITCCVYQKTEDKKGGACGTA